MPYIQAASRKELDGLIDELALRLVQDAKKDDPHRVFAGLLNYTCTRLALKVVRLQFGSLRYCSSPCSPAFLKISAMNFIAAWAPHTKINRRPGAETWIYSRNI